MNMYAYVGGDPINFTDPSGTSRHCDYWQWTATDSQLGTVARWITATNCRPTYRLIGFFNSGGRSGGGGGGGAGGGFPRGLTSAERAVIPKCIAKGIDLGKVNIFNRKWTPATPENTTVTRGYKIYWPNAPQNSTGVGQLSHVVHEVTHVWQYKYLGVGRFSPRWLNRKYDFTLTAGDTFQSFGLEQQASIAQENYLAANGLSTGHNRLNASGKTLSSTVSKCEDKP